MSESYTLNSQVCPYMDRVSLLMGLDQKLESNKRQPNNTKIFTFPTLLPSRAPCKISKNTPSPDYIIGTILLVISEKLNPDQMLCTFLCLSLMSRVSADRYMNLTQAEMLLQGSHERSTMTMTPPTPLKN
jgi:hypothetical protein